MTLFKTIRVLILLLLFLGLAFYAQQQKLKSRNWTEPLRLVIYPINAEPGNPTVDDYIRELDDGVFAPLDRFFADQSRDYDLIVEQPTVTTLGPVVSVQPPPAPLPDAGYAAIIWWGIQFRYWVYRNTPDADSNIRRVRVFVQYHAAGKDKRLQHSLGLDKGLVALVQAFAAIDHDQRNNVVIAHEVLHTVGATDKYAADNSALFPLGYADPDRSPLYPQQRAEIMAGRIPLSETRMRMPESLAECMLGDATAREINWLR
ncbi:hypothetical protein NP590_15180 [Methylomonas sp. SURF-2]|uniref:Uncharacterized protein n=1 Tax=Methylomonas subterranea TaxID=2952225 RepID=A0ABT1TJ11_9GAMM|nr:hypothetical protein [Methylomonas sp. SURF-2]MCQ8105455.1 hypothetical protein [Methylomonas sp. SURF-2]